MSIGKYYLGPCPVKPTVIGIQADISRDRKDCGLVGEIRRHLDVAAGIIIHHITSPLHYRHRMLPSFDLHLP
jgi:hypothetical protein